MENNLDFNLIIQIGVAKSGNFWLYTILKKILSQGNLPVKSFVKSQNIYSSVDDSELSVVGQKEIDVVDIENDGISWRISSIYKENINNINHYLSRTSILWTHSKYCLNTDDFFKKINKKIYIIRDPRDVSISMANFMMTDYMKKNYPNDHTSSNEALSKILSNSIKHWKIHTDGYIKYFHNKDFLVVFYEKLKSSPSVEIKRISRFLEIELTSNQLGVIVDSVSFKSMKEKNPKHLRQGSKAGWITKLSDSQIKICENEIGASLKLLNYPINKNDDRLPLIPSLLKLRIYNTKRRLNYYNRNWKGILKNLLISKNER